MNKPMVKIVIEISEDDYFWIRQASEGLTCYPCTLRIQEAIKNNTPLPKGHGRLIDADAFERRCMFDSSIEDMQDVIYALRDYKPIIEADKGDKE